MQKLKEFDAYIADELPAYILVMLDNKRPWEEIGQELEVFLVESTEPFVEWLKQEVNLVTDVSQKSLSNEPRRMTQESVTQVEAKQMSIVPKEAGKTAKRAPSPPRPQREARPSVPSPAPMQTTITTTTTTSATNKQGQHREESATNRQGQRRERSRSPLGRERTRSRRSLDRYHPHGRRKRSDRSPSPRRHQRRSGDERERTRRKSREEDIKTDVRLKENKIQPDLSQTPSGQKLPSKGVEDEDAVPIHAEDEFQIESGSENEDNSKAEDARHLLNRGRVSSRVVKIPEKERPRISSSSLLLKKAIAGVHDDSIPYPRLRHTTRSSTDDTVEGKQQHPQQQDEKDSFHTARKRVEGGDKDDLRVVISRKREHDMLLPPRDDDVAAKDISSKDSFGDHAVTSGVQKDREDDIGQVSSKQSRAKGSGTMGTTKESRSSGVEQSEQPKVEAPKSGVKRPRLVMTDSGLMTYKSLVKSGVIIDEDYPISDDDDEITDEALHKGMLDLSKSQEVTSSQEEEVISETVLQHPMERCRFWPNCKNGDKCTYHHPTVPCKLFPKCRFGNKCLYVHPTCKFDARCTRHDCPYLHTVPKQKVSSSYPGGLMMSPGFPSPVPFPMSYPKRGRGKPHFADPSQFKWTPGKSGVAGQTFSTTPEVHISERRFATAEKPASFPVL